MERPVGERSQRFSKNKDRIYGFRSKAHSKIDFLIFKVTGDCHDWQIDGRVDLDWGVGFGDVEQR